MGCVVGASLRHPGVFNVYGGKGDAALALTHYMHETATEWLAEKARNHRPERRTVGDRVVAIDEAGHTIGGAQPRNYLNK